MIFDKGYMDSNYLLKLTKDLIREAGIRPSKKLGQHFTIDPGLVEEIVEHARSLGCSSETVLEVGTGFGVVTRYLAMICRRIITVEMDKKIGGVARKMLEGLGNIEIILGDALEVIDDLSFSGVVGTIPYSITGPLLGAIARSTARWAVLVLQKDVIDRITSPPGTRSYGSISVVLNLAFRIERGNIYPPQSFYPEPAVFSQTIVLKRREPGITIEKAFEEFTKCIFSQRKRLAYKAIKSCTGAEIGRTSMRIFQMSPEEIYRIYSSLVKTKADI